MAASKKGIARLVSVEKQLYCACPGNITPYSRGAEMAVKYRVGDKDERPWGRYVVTGIGPGYATKKIEVEPGKRLSDQRHRGRTEVWTVDSGFGEVELEDDSGKRTIMVQAGDQVVIPSMTWHRIRNTRTVLVLKFREVQVGDCDEADIERRSDDYGRVADHG